jgi:hypothetical protein
MDIVKALRELYREKKRLDTAIASLEARLKTARPATSGAKPRKGRRGRKSMGAAERLEVSKRMTLYWEARRRAEGRALQGSALRSDDHQTNSNAAS